MESQTTQFSPEIKLAGMEALISLILSTMSVEQRVGLSVHGLELIKLMKNQPPSLRERGQEICEYISEILDTSVDLS
ncbi:Uncharacterised protein [Buttiauxella agrestis]|uniref:Uncharacterized protein n=1 Tax=Buttiauxella agrestis TaxID=82977 RepID=A0A381C8H1_9ENTR|nr:Uncharacterised protein [Buttiauxella agrestis]